MREKVLQFLPYNGIIIVQKERKTIELKKEHFMWIRSQDRTKLVDASELNICSSYKVVGIYAGINALGMYSTEEKAMKVMDMIESAIIEHEIAKAKSKIIFYMPKDDEVDR